jgi:hypothetical protein
MRKNNILIYYFIEFITDKELYELQFYKNKQNNYTFYINSTQVNENIYFNF